MDLAAIERSLRASGAAALLVEPRLLRRVIKRHRSLPGLGLQVPHARCYAIPRGELFAITPQGALGVGPGDDGDPAEPIILVARPAPHELLGKAPYEILAGLWRTTFHARIHVELDRRFERGALTAASVRERIDAIGQAEFDEIRLVLRHDELLLPPADDRSAYTEFAALYLELSYFAPRLLRRVFPSLREFKQIDAIIAADVDAAAALEASRPEGAASLSDVVRRAKDTTTPTFSAPASVVLFQATRVRPPSKAHIPRYKAAADVARAKGNSARAALLRLTAASAASGDEAAALRAGARSDLEELSERLAATLKRVGGDEDATPPEWTSLLLMVAEEATARRGLRYPVEARLLYDLQRACIASERPERAVDLVTWALSLGARPIIRPLPLTREVRVVRAVRLAEAKLRHVRIAAADRKLLGRLLRWARERGESNVRAALRPKINDVLSGVGLRPMNAPERVAQRKLVEELLDHVVLRGYLSIGALRDALSRNQMKLDDLTGPLELLAGDALIEADRRLSIDLDGVYRRGEVYLRSLQRLSSIAFGTLSGRRVVLYMALPFGAAFVLLEGASHMLNPLLGLAHLGPLHLVSLPVFLATSAILFALIHSERARLWARRWLAMIGSALGALFVRFPRWVLALPAVKAVVQSAIARGFARYVVAPLAAAAVLYAVTPMHELSKAARFAGLGGLFLAANLLINSRVGVLVEEIAVDWLVRQWGALARRVLPGLLRFTIDTFRALMELLERAIYKVDELLRFRDGDHRVVIGSKAALGVVWFFVAYIIRLYVCLLIEPEVNPIKHFPVVTVAHKIVLPFTPPILHAFQSLLSPFGAVVANAIAGPTVFLLPSIFGFLVWEFKENWRLYRASRSRALTAALVGGHGETMNALLAPGFHSGTLPKLFAKIRRAARRADEEAGVRVAGPDGGIDAGPEEAKAEGSLGPYREALHEVEQAVRRLFERELLDLLRESPSFPHNDVEVKSVDLGSNRVRVELVCRSLSKKPCEIAFEEQSGLVVAGISRAGFLEALAGPPTDADGEAKAAAASPRLVFENALVGLYKLAAVDLVREQIEAAIPAGSPYDVSDEGLLVWPGEGYRSEVVYRLSVALGGPMIWPVVRGERPASPPPPLDARRVLFREQPILWRHWVDAWSPERARAGMIPRLLRGAAIVPSGPSDAKAAQQ